MVLDILTPRGWDILSPGGKNAQQILRGELDSMIVHFPNAKPKDLKRFLMGFHQKADKAIPAYEAHLKWRAENLPVAKESCLAELQKGRFYFHGVDKKGRPVAYYSLACHDPKHRDIAEIMRMMTYQVEKALSEMPEGVKGFTIVWDTRNTGVKNTDNEFLREFLNFFRAQYPEVLAQLVIAPVGFLQRAMWNTFARFLDERRASRIRMVATMEGLREYVEPEELLASCGGEDAWVFDPSQV